MAGKQLTAEDLLGGAAWECAATEAGVVNGPWELPADLHWWPAQVPGTTASALRAAGEWVAGAERDGHAGDGRDFDGRDFDADDWWFRCHVASPRMSPHHWLLRVGGIATLADVWLDGALVLTSDNMWVAADVAVPAPAPGAQLVIRCRSLRAALETQKPRPRWKTRLVDTQSMRWVRTALVGRMPGWGECAAPVGPWRQLSLVPAPVVSLASVRLQATCAGDGGVVTLHARLTGRTPASAALTVNGERSELAISSDAKGAFVTGALRLDAVERWWPRGYGSQPLYDVTVDLDGVPADLGRVGFRELTVDRNGGAFTISVNGVSIFCRGACWVPVDPVGLAPAAADQRAAVQQATTAGLNMLRVTGTMAYEDPAFWDACDELGVLVWQDVMCADMDYPDAPEFLDAVTTELAGVFGGLQGRPALAVVSGGSETEQQATMLGLPADRRTSRLATDLVPRLVDEWLTGTPYVVSTPTGGALAIRSDSGVAHYFGVGGYRRPLSDARTAGVRFAAECLAFATPPERATMQLFGGPAVINTDRWKLGVPHDNGSSWDFEDVRDHYVRELFSVEPDDLRRTDPDRALDLGRAAVAAVMAVVFSEWRRAASGCAGALVLSLRDLIPGAGVGLIDSTGVPKAPFYALARVNAPVALLAVDEGLNGLRLHVCNDGPEALDGTLRVTVYSAAGPVTEQAQRAITAPARGVVDVDAEDVLGGFRDLTWAYRFGPAAADVVLAELLDGAGAVVVQTIHFVGGPTRPVFDIGLAARLEAADGGWHLVVSTRAAAQFVSIDCPGFAPADSWFHLPPGGHARVPLAAQSPGLEARPTGFARALNGVDAAVIG